MVLNSSDLKRVLCPLCHGTGKPPTKVDLELDLSPAPSIITCLTATLPAAKDYIFVGQERINV